MNYQQNREWLQELEDEKNHEIGKRTKFLRANSIAANKKRLTNNPKQNKQKEQAIPFNQMIGGN